MAYRNNHYKPAILLPISLLAIMLPAGLHAQDSGLSGSIGGLQTTLQQVYNSMIVHCGELIDVGRAIAAFGAMWYIFGKVLVHIGTVQPIQIMPLLRPFGIGLAILLFPSLIALINGVMQPTVSGSAALVNDANQAVATLLQQKEAALKNSNDWQMYVGTNGSGDLDKWEQLSGDADSGVFSGVSNRVKFEMAKLSYNMKGSVRVWLSEILQVLFEAATLCLNTVRTFFLIVLAIFGPLALGLAVFPGFENTLLQWLRWYISIFLWLPIANIFGSLIAQIQQEMIQLDINQLATSGQTSFGPTDTAYLIFLLMAILGYCTVPMIAGQIVQTSGGAIGTARSRIFR